MALYGTIATVRAQLAARPGFEIAFAYAEELLRAGSPVQARVRAIEAGQRQRTELGNGVFVSEECYLTKARSDGFFESHRKYIDLQIIFEGAELMEVADIGAITARADYDPTRDLILYADTPAASLLRVWPGQAAVFFPADVHMPTLRVGDAAQLTRKCVVKIPVA